MGGQQLDARLSVLSERGVVVVDPRQTWVSEDVDVDRVRPGATLHPGTRLRGSRTFIASTAQVGAQGPATLVDSVLGEGAVVDAGYLEGAVLLRGARAGWGAHFRPGTVLEEEASTAHAVGLKHTVLLSFVTVGSVANFCDVLMAGGTSRRDHSEVGSGFIHFNFTPWGARGDKATPSLIGDVVRGVFLRESRIFLGGAGGLVGPGRVGYGAVTAAGQVVRRPVPAGKLVYQAGRELETDRPAGSTSGERSRVQANLEYIGELCALRAWYRDVRRARIPDGDAEAIVIDAAAGNIDSCIAERVNRLEAYALARGETVPTLELATSSPCPLDVAPASPHVDHVSWVQALPEDDVNAGIAWLSGIARASVGAVV